MEISSRFQFDQGKRWQMGAFFFPVWDTLPCYPLHFEAKPCTLLNFGAKFAICTVHRFFHVH